MYGLPRIAYELLDVVSCPHACSSICKATRRPLPVALPRLSEEECLALLCFVAWSEGTVTYTTALSDKVYGGLLRRGRVEVGGPGGKASISLSMVRTTGASFQPAICLLPTPCIQVSCKKSWTMKNSSPQIWEPSLRAGVKQQRLLCVFP